MALLLFVGLKRVEIVVCGNEGEGPFWIGGGGEGQVCSPLGPDRIVGNEKPQRPFMHFLPARHRWYFLTTVCRRSFFLSSGHNGR